MLFESTHLYKKKICLLIGTTYSFHFCMDRLQKDRERYMGSVGSAFWDRICTFLSINPSKFENYEKMLWGIKSNSRETDQTGKSTGNKASVMAVPSFETCSAVVSTLNIPMSTMSTNSINTRGETCGWECFSSANTDVYVIVFKVCAC